jgi:hypothetical protein
MIQYTEYTSPLGGTFILRVDENGLQSHIPLDPANSDYQRYLNPEAEQSTPSV